MSWETYILDPDGEVNILLEYPDYHFAPWNNHEEPPAEESPAEELPVEEPPAKKPPAEGHLAKDPIIFEEQLEEWRLELLAKVTILADYYQCQALVQYFADRWIESLRVNLSIIYSRDSILWSSNRIINLGLPILEQLRDSFISESRGCCFEYSSIILGALTKQMHSSALLSPQSRPPFINLNYNELVETVHAFKSPKWPAHWRACEASSFSSLINMQESIPLQVKQTQKDTSKIRHNCS
ncbi:hypothetical protein BDV37DRAFT_276498 [Aspergillus pseudonomiae]|uniref:Uncharacterized protein n=1 Tax=Aspergillus pseudonomiae TaxID=1506151 RepID=A0A5N7CUU3_9EURO|nr:uncharacterized protein BDV37DRAFT_276498 [Aspergillus pseudonomiae]KAE8397976.1 hypothetical protein BDV37DRAFT_276498 [Aspergillus pseudonomiae]